MRSLIFPLVIFAGIAYADATPPSVTVSWTAPTLNTDATPIVGALTYQLYVGASGKEVSFGKPVASAPYVITPTPAPGSTLCAQVTAIANAVESARTSEACTTIPYPTPNSPTVITIVTK